MAPAGDILGFKAPLLRVAAAAEVGVALAVPAAGQTVRLGPSTTSAAAAAAVGNMAAARQETKEARMVLPIKAEILWVCLMTAALAAAVIMAAAALVIQAAEDLVVVAADLVILMELVLLRQH